MSRYPMLNRKDVQLKPLAERGHDLLAENVSQLTEPQETLQHPEFDDVVSAIQQARNSDRPVILMMGGHPIKLGLSRYIIDLMEQGFITHVATNGAGIIHDFELASFGGTSENVAKWIREGQFGLWHETSRLNGVIQNGAANGEGLGEVVGRTLVENQAPHLDVSICAAGWRLGIPVTSHVLMGGDILHSQPNMDGGALGQATANDFLIFSHSVSQLEGGVFLNLGTAVVGPEVFLKALSMARNLARQNGTSISHFTTAVFDMVPLPPDYRDGPPGKDKPLYYYRPWKSILCRTVGDEGDSFYVQGDHQQTIPSLWHKLIRDRYPP